MSSRFGDSSEPSLKKHRVDEQENQENQNQNQNQERERSGTPIMNNNNNNGSDDGEATPRMQSQEGTPLYNEDQDQEDEEENFESNQQQQQVDSHFERGAIDLSFLAGIGTSLDGLFGTSTEDSSSSADKNKNKKPVVDQMAIQEDFAQLTNREQGLVRRYLDLNRVLTEEELDTMIPSGYEIVTPPADLLDAARKQEMLNQQQAGGTGAAASSGAASATDAAVASAAHKQSRRIDLPADRKLAPDLPPINDAEIVFFELLIEYRHCSSDEEIPLEHRKKVQVLRSILKFKNGELPRHRRMGGIDLITRATHYGALTVLKPLTELWLPSATGEEGLLENEADRHRTVKLLSSIIMKLRDNIPSEQVRDILVLIQPSLGTSVDRYVREEGREIMSSLIKTVGAAEIIVAVRNDMNRDDEKTRFAAAETLALVAETLGLEGDLLEVIKILCRSKKGYFVRSSGIRVIYEITKTRAGPTMCRRCIIPLVESCVEGLRWDDSGSRTEKKLRKEAAYALASLADVMRPSGFEAFVRNTEALKLLRDQLSKTRNKDQVPYLQAVGSIMVLMPPQQAREQALVLSEYLRNCFSSTDDGLRGVALRVVDQCISCEGIEPAFLQEHFLLAFLESAWSEHAFMERMHVRQLLTTTGNFAKKIAGSHILAHLREKLEHDGPRILSSQNQQQQQNQNNNSNRGMIYVRAIVEGIRIVSQQATLQGVSDESLHGTFFALLDTLARDSDGSCSWIDQTIAAFCLQAGTRFAPLAPRLISTISNRLSDRRMNIRRQAADLLSRTAICIADNAPEHLDSLRISWIELDDKIIKQRKASTFLGEDDEDQSAVSRLNTEDANVGKTVATGMKACAALATAWCRDLNGRVTNAKLLSEAREHVSNLLDSIGNALKSHAFKRDDDIKEHCVRSVLAIVEIQDRINKHFGEDFIMEQQQKESENTGNTATSMMSDEQQKDIGANAYQIAPVEKLFSIAVDSLLLLLREARRVTRTLTAQAFGKIANLTSPLQIIKKLIDRGIRRDDQRYRTSAGIALAVVAQTCRPFVVIPFLTYEYEQSRGTEAARLIQHATLKTIRFIFEHIAGDVDAVPCIHAVLPLIEFALTERELQHRRMACEAVREMMLACAHGLDPEQTMRPVWLHLLNFVLVTYIDASELNTDGQITAKEKYKALSVAVEVFEAAQLVLAPAYVLQVLSQGMYHPKRAVRDLYWNTYNLISIRSGESLVPYYPSISDESLDEQQQKVRQDEINVAIASASASQNQNQNQQQNVNGGERRWNVSSTTNYHRHILETIV